MLEERRGQEFDPASVPLSQIMTDNVVSTTPETPIEELAAEISARGVSGMPVLDPQGRAIGVVTRTDLVRWAFRPKEVRCRLRLVADVMTPMVLTLPEETPIARAAALMSFEGVHRLFVTGADGKLCGVASAIDLLGWVAKTGGYVGPCPDPVVDPADPAELGVGD